jgi:hypothetical protein
VRLTDNAYRRRVLRQLEDEVLRATGNRSERVLLLSEDGTILYRKDGPRDGVDFTAAEVDEWRGRVDLATHNHPVGLPFTLDDVLAAQSLDVREVNAFTPAARYRLLVTPGGTWPTPAEIVAALKAIDPAIASVIRRGLMSGAINTTDALVLQREARWHHLARRFAGNVDYIVEER